MATPFTITDKTYDGLDLPASAVAVTVRCRNCGDEDTLVENTLVPRSMGAFVYQRSDEDGGGYTADLYTAHDDAFWEAESDHKWGCSSCVAESKDIAAIFEVVS